MFSFLLHRLSVLVPIFFGVTLVSFSFIRVLPGDPVETLAGERGVSPERHAELLAMLGLDKPLWQQYLTYVGDILQGDFGRSFITNRPVFSEFIELFPATVELAFCAMTFAIVVGLPVGLLAATKRGTIYDQGLMGISLAGYSMPIFWWALLLIIVFSGNLQWTPVSGRIDLLYYFPDPTGFMLIDSLNSGQTGAFKSAVRHLILPTIVLGTIPLAVIARQTRSAMLEVLGEDYIRTARAKGLSETTVLIRHALKNSISPIVSVMGPLTAGLVTGSFVIEYIFSIPGMGNYFITAVTNRDYPIIMGVTLVYAVLIVLANIMVDLIYMKLDPRVALSNTGK